MANTKKKPAPRVCRFCQKVYTPSGKASKKRDWCPEYNCETAREALRLDAVRDHMRKRNAPRGATTP